MKIKVFNIVIVSSCYRGTRVEPFHVWFHVTLNSTAVLFLSISLERRWFSVESIRQESRFWGWPTSVLLFLRFSFTLQTSASRRWASQRPSSTPSSPCQKVSFCVVSLCTTQVGYVHITGEKSDLGHSSCNVNAAIFTYNYHVVYVWIWESNLNNFLCHQRCSPTSTRTLSWLEETLCYQASESVWRQSCDPSPRPTSLCQSCYLQSKWLRPISHDLMGRVLILAHADLLLSGFMIIYFHMVVNAYCLVQSNLLFVGRRETAGPPPRLRWDGCDKRGLWRERTLYLWRKVWYLTSLSSWKW